MNIKEGMGEEYAKWVKEMKGVGLDDAVICFNLICKLVEDGMESIVVVTRIVESKNAGGTHIFNKDEIYLALRAFSNFHQRGDKFRQNWNTSLINMNYSVYIEEGKIKYLFNPFTSSIILENYDDKKGPENEE